MPLPLLLAVLAGCHSHTSTPGIKSPDSAATKTSPADVEFLPILYHRTGGIAGTDDRVVIWPDGRVDVSGKILSPGSAKLSDKQLRHLRSLFDGWDKLRNQYLAGNVIDAYLITICYGDKTITAWDLAPDLPPQFRQIFTEIEAIAAGAATATPSPDQQPPNP